MSDVAQRLALAGRFLNLGAIDDADRLCAGLEAGGLEFPELDYLRGLIESAKGEARAAAAAMQRAIAVRPAFAAVHAHLAESAWKNGNPSSALRAARRAIALAPATEGTWTLFGLALEADNRPEAAIAVLGPRVGEDAAPELRSRLARLHRLVGDRETSAAQFDRLIADRPAYRDAWRQRAMLHQGDFERERRCLYRAVALAPDDNDALRRLGELYINGTASPDVLRMLHQDGWVRAQALVSPAIAALAGDLEAILADEAPAALLAGPPPGWAREDSLLAGLMPDAIMTDARLEAWLTRFRRGFLERVEAGAPIHPGWRSFLESLALQAFISEYVWAQSEAERNAVDRLLKRPEPTPEIISAVAAYRPLEATPFANLADLPARLRIRQVEHPREERRLAAAMPQLTTIGDGVSAAVREQYEESPFPRWYGRQKPSGRTTLGTHLRTLFPYCPEADVGILAPRILVAGCGTGLQLFQTATRFIDGHVTAIDLSLASLSYARRQCAAAGLDNIDFYQADITRLGEIDQRFDIIESVGVLHHLEDPEAGWRVLTGLLKPGGVMLIGLYSAHARRIVRAARDAISEGGYGQTKDGVRRFRQAILADPGHYLYPLTASTSFYGMSDCRDLLFHVQEHQLTLPQLAGILDRLNLTFLGFEGPPLEGIDRYRELWPEDLPMNDLARWDEVEREQPGMFASMYNFWVRKT